MPLTELKPISVKSDTLLMADIYQQLVLVSERTLQSSNGWRKVGWGL